MEEVAKVVVDRVPDAKITIIPPRPKMLLPLNVFQLPKKDLNHTTEISPAINRVPVSKDLDHNHSTKASLSVDCTVSLVDCVPIGKKITIMPPKLLLPSIMFQL